MNYDRNKTKEQLIAELESLRLENLELRNHDSKQKGPINTGEGQGQSWKNSLLSRVLLDSVQEIVAIKDTNGVHRAPSSGMCNLVGKPESYIIGCTDFDLFPYKQATFYEEMDSEVIETKESRQVEEQVKGQQGTAWMQTTKSPLFDQSGECIGVIVEVRDVTEQRQKEQELRKREQEIQTIFDTVTSGIILVDKQGRIVHANKTMKEMLNYDMEQIIGSSYADYVFESEKEKAETRMYQLMDGTIDSVDLERLYQRSDGTTFWGRLSGKRQYYPDGSFWGLIGVITDITDRIQAEQALRQSEERFRLVIDATNDGVWDWDINSNQVYYSPNYIKMLGYESTEFPAHIQTWLDLIHPEDKEEVFKANTDCLDNLTDSFAVEFRMQTKNGDWKWIMGRGSAVERDHSGRATRMVGAHSDITDRKQAEQALLYAKEQAEAANRAKSEFLANMSHEIRTPINGIMGMLQLLKNSSLDEAQEKYVKTGLDSTKRLNRLLTDILDLSKIEANKLVIREDEFVFADVIKTIEDIFNQLTRENRNDISISLDDKIPEKLVGDSTRLNQILFNLVGNANKYTQNGRVELDAYLMPCSKDFRCPILFVITDNGIGIPEGNIQKVFQVFTQGSDSSSYTREFEGAGLGLPLVRRLVYLMNGNISISSQEGEGTSVYVSLPFGIPESLQQDWSYLLYRQQTPEAKNLRVLLVDDDETTQLYIKDLLEMKGINTIVAGNGREGLKELEKGEFDCVLMDIQMPVLDGVEATRQIRSANSNFQNIPIIAMTAYAMSGDREKFLDKNMDDYISKPIDQDELWAVLARNLPGLKSS